VRSRKRQIFSERDPRGARVDRVSGETVADAGRDLDRRPFNRLLWGVCAMRKNVKVLWVVALLALAGLPRPAAAQLGTDHQGNAKAYLQDFNRARASLRLIQFGCTLKRVSCAEPQAVLGGGFTVTARYAWSGLDNGNDYTDIVYEFNNQGRLTGLQVGKTSATVFRPFSVANGVLQLLGDGIREQMRDASPEARNVADLLIRQANARSLHLLVMQIQQPR
jgi:hypothetical protein